MPLPRADPLLSTGRARWREVSRLASRQAGRVSREQLRAIGFTRNAVRLAVADHRLIPRPGGIFLVGHAYENADGLLWVGLLTGGRGSVLSHTTAAGVWRLLPPPRDRVEVISPARWTTSAPEVTIHQHRLDARRDVTHRHGVPVTRMLSTIVHLAAELSHARLAVAVQQAAVRGQLHARNLERLLELSRFRAGAPKLREVLATRDTSKGMPKGGLEVLFAEIARDAGLPAYERGGLVDIGDGDLCECDVVWHRYRVMVELDYLPHHETGFVPIRDRRRDRRLTAAGWVVIRLTSDDLLHLRDEVIRDLLAALERGGYALAA